MNRKHLVAIGVVIAVLLLLYWLFVAEDMNAWLNVNWFFGIFVWSYSDKDVSSQKNIKKYNPIWLPTEKKW